MQLAQQSVALPEQRLTVARKVDHRRCIGQHGQHGSLGPRQLAGRVTEVAPRGGFHPDHVTAERRVRGVERQDLPLAVATFEPSGQNDLNQLLPHRAPFAARESDGLHGDRAPPADDASRPDVLHEGAQDGGWVDAVVEVEMTILEGDEAAGKLVWRRVGGREAPLSVGGDACTEQLTVAIGDDGGVRHVEQSARQAQQVSQQQKSHPVTDGSYWFRIPIG